MTSYLLHSCDDLTDSTPTNHCDRERKREREREREGGKIHVLRLHKKVTLFLSLFLRDTFSLSLSLSLLGPVIRSSTLSLFLYRCVYLLTQTQLLSLSLSLSLIHAPYILQNTRFNSLLLTLSLYSSQTYSLTITPPIHTVTHTPIHSHRLSISIYASILTPVSLIRTLSSSASLHLSLSLIHILSSTLIHVFNQTLFSHSIRLPKRIFTVFTYTHSVFYHSEASL